MRILVLFIAILLSFTPVLAKTFKKDIPPLPSSIEPFPIDEEYQNEFVGFDKLEFQEYEKEQKLNAKLEKKRQKLIDKKTKLEEKKEAKIKNCERSQLFIDQLKASEIENSESSEEF